MTPDDFRRLVNAGLTSEQIAIVMEMMSRDAQAAADAEEARRAQGRERWHRWNDKRKPNVSKREPTLANDSCAGDARLEDKSSNLDISKKDIGAKKRKKAASRLPDDFKPDIEWAMARGLKRSTAELQAEKFTNYWLAAKDGLKTDWEAAWRTWVLNHIERNGTDGHVSQATQPVDAERWRKRLVFGRDKASWASVDWGPPPGKPGCLVPPELLKPGDGTGWEEWKSQSAA